MLFEWDDEKNRKNIETHGIDFETAVHVFSDPNRIELYDDIHSTLEDRYITIGMIGNDLHVIVVVYTDKNGIIRMISARYATGKERRIYYGYYS